ncbi:hypothetical protein P8C59_004606 [Phyllachora maydis]|uniref:Uncharacterized protein n=1 Tax=Phyllachora maydis TaxID=1825666 RepID=A0AAD9I313_9PEZI|nr:hypothetical protein P8C59_004606 [Phyllachora maydis]
MKQTLVEVVEPRAGSLSASADPDQAEGTADLRLAWRNLTCNERTIGGWSRSWSTMSWASKNEDQGRRMTDDVRQTTMGETQCTRPSHMPSRGQTSWMGADDRLEYRWWAQAT